MSEIDKLLDQHGKAITEVYLDWENGSKIDKEVLDTMLPFYLDRKFGNPAITHRFGWETYDFFIQAKKT
ncbi:MAG: cysteine desulfurase family protein, partial [Candidatus Heimdallarchaeaceae archaeon]